ncbi:hypothetical protein D3C87_1957680 [compost metagenome]
MRDSRDAFGDGLTVAIKTAPVNFNGITFGYSGISRDRNRGSAVALSRSVINFIISCFRETRGGERAFCLAIHHSYRDR